MKQRKLRTGFTTGATATACAVAGWHYKHGISCNPVSILFPDGEEREIPLHSIRQEEEAIIVTAYKDGGDDIDCTNRAEIAVTLTLSDEKERVEDHSFELQKKRLIIRGGKGVGIVTRKGLDVPRGKYAINPTPQKMLLDNMQSLPYPLKQNLIITISVPEGEKLARKTLNPQLGIVGGISILGTSGIVVPCSHKAYNDTISILIRGCITEKIETISLVTGGRSFRSLQELYPTMQEIAFIRVGDFIEHAITEAQKYGLKKIIVGCMAGKLAKYALGYSYTHAATIRTSMHDLSNILREENISDNHIIEECKTALSVRSFLEELSEEEQKRVIDILAQKAIQTFQQWANDLSFTIILLNFNGTKRGVWHG